jgi:sulfur relay (sulfurtransferase) DsrF/TusC family protein
VLFPLFVTGGRGTVGKRKGRETNTALLGKRKSLGRKDLLFRERGVYCLYKNKDFSEVSGKKQRLETKDTDFFFVLNVKWMI